MVLCWSSFRVICASPVVCPLAPERMSTGTRTCENTISYTILLPVFLPFLVHLSGFSPVSSQCLSSVWTTPDGALQSDGAWLMTQVADTVYQELGRVLTISGRTIRLEAQETPDAASGAERAIDGFLQKVCAGPTCRW